MENREVNIPQADKLVGIPKEWMHNLDRFEETMEKAYQTQGTEKIEGLELEKGEKEIEIIHFVNESILEYLRQYGREIEVDSSFDKIHILKEGGTEEYTKGKLRMGAHSTKLGSILVDRGLSNVQFANILFHEQMHNNSYKALQITKEEKPKLEQYRAGISVTSRDGKVIYFEDFEEAIIQLLTEKFYNNEVLNSQIFQEELAKEVEPPYFSRAEESEKLNNTIEDVWLNNQEDFESRKDVEDVFIDAQINGRLLPLARLIEKTYGKGSFRKLGEK